MIQRFRLATAKVAQLVRHGRVGKILPLIAHFDAGISHLVEFEGTAHIKLETGFKAACQLGFFLMQFCQFGFGIECVHVTGTTLHEQHNARLGFGREHRFFWGASGPCDFSSAANKSVNATAPREAPMPYRNSRRLAFEKAGEGERFMIVFRFEYVG